MSRPFLFLISGIILCAAVGGAILFFMSRGEPLTPPSVAPLAENAPSPVWDGEQTAREVAMRAAVAWRADAMLATIQSVNTGDAANRAEAWKLIFIAPSAPGKGYLVQVADQRVAEATEMDYVAPGAVFPPSLMTAEEAVEAIHQLPGYEQVEVLGVEAVYGASNATWYWGVKTPRGTVSIEATKK